MAIPVGLASVSAASEPDEIPEPRWERLFLRSGDELTGRSLETSDGRLVWMYRDGDILHIPLDQIERLEAGPPLIPPSPAPAEPSETINADDGASWLESVPFLSTLRETYSTASNTAEKWTSRLQLGGQFNGGNTKTDLIDVVGVFERNTKEQMRQIDVGGQWGQNRGRQTANRWWLNSNFDWPVHDKWIAFVTSKNEYNEPANLDYRGTLSAGGGYRFVFEDKRRLIVRFGPAYTVEIFISPYNIRHTPDIFSELELRWPVFQRTTLEQKMRVQPSLLNWELVRVFSTTGLMVDLDEKDRWKLRVGLQYQYNSRPNPGRVPSDYMTTLSLVYQRK
jgi:putative salt-induced outer membrane protein YdiY